MSSLRAPFLVVSLTLLSGAAHAATVQGGKAVPQQAYGTRAQLREGLDLDDSLKARLRDMQAAAARKRNDEAIDAEEARPADVKAKLDRGDKNAIQAFNQAIQAHRLQIQQSDQDAATADAVRQVYTNDMDSMDRKCGGLTYRPADVDAVAKERQKAASAP